MNYDPGAAEGLAIHQNPFWLLGATTRDSTQRIIALADEKSLTLDETICNKARSDLTTPALRVTAEIGWLPGLSPKKAEQLIAKLGSTPLIAGDDEGLPTLARANLMSSAFQKVGVASDQDFALLPSGMAADFIKRFSQLVDAIDAEQVVADVNADRAVSGFPELRGIDQIEAQLTELKRQYRNVVIAALDRMEPDALLEALTGAVQIDTDDGESAGGAFLADLVDAYKEEAKGLLLSEAEKINVLASHARAVAAADAQAVSDDIAKIDEIVSSWVRLVAPVQLSYKARGMDEPMSYELAGNIRSLGVDLFNRHALAEQAQRITDLLQKRFEKVRAVTDQVVEDAQAIQSITEGWKKSAKERTDWEREITWQTDVGLLFTNRLAISPAGIEWDGSKIALDTITRARWGGIRKSVNGIPTGTDYTVAVGDNRREIVVRLRDAKKYEEFIGRLWRAVGVRLMSEMLNTLRTGGQLRFREATVIDSGVTLPERKFFGTNPEVFCAWNQVKIWSASGSFLIGATDNKKIYASMSYVEVANVHFLEHLVRLFFKSGKPNISSLLDG